MQLVFLPVIHLELLSILTENVDSVLPQEVLRCESHILPRTVPWLGFMDLLAD